MTDTVMPRRSVLYVPADNARALAKLPDLDADAVIVDLEDAVAPARKAAAREAAIAALARAAGPGGPGEWILRINGQDTPWWAEDVAAAAGSGADAVLVPKVDDADGLRRVAAALAAAGAPRDLPLWAMAETPAGILGIDAIAAVAGVVVMGTADLARALRLPDDPARTGLLAALAQCVLAARRHGIDILDGVYGRLGDPDGFRRACEQGRALGFDGKTLIHPGQIATANEVFGVGPAALAEARALIAAWETAEAEGRGIAVHDGRMVERLHAEEARRLVALDAAIRSR